MCVVGFSIKLRVRARGRALLNVVIVSEGNFKEKFLQSGVTVVRYDLPVAVINDVLIDFMILLSIPLSKMFSFVDLNLGITHYSHMCNVTSHNSIEIAFEWVNEYVGGCY